MHTCLSLCISTTIRPHTKYLIAFCSAPWCNHFPSYKHTYKLGYKRLQGWFSTHAHDFQLCNFAVISAVVQTHESRYCSPHRAPRADSYTLLKPLNISFLSEVIKGHLIFPFDILTGRSTLLRKWIQPSKISIMLSLNIVILYIIIFLSVS